MENFDAFTLFFAGASLGIILGHWLGKADRRLEYERGHNDGINLLWPYLVAYWTRELLTARTVKPAGDTPSGGAASSQ